ncbi:alpha-glucosidase [Curtobacterium ammoniigenes]|uniref:alpha-glucosidase n=1 Tax=Curtobacterium ammoniigenes TaxID=395387 RepID=UPI00082F7A84|nr:alpha-glucosidase [Curtobacterium ammoniigenes]
MTDSTVPAWWTTAVVYQIYPRSFADGNGDGIGDLRGIRGHLDHLQDLGVDVVWLSPIYRSPQADNGYDISDYEDIDPMFGTIDEFDTLLGEIHARGMKLMMDLVVNHTSDEHPWFQAARSSTKNPKHDWYIWRRPIDGAEPNRWRSAFGGPAWAWNPPTQEYFLHMFAPQQPDLNWANPAMRDAIYTMMNRWLDRGVDGFRMDVIDHIAKDPDALIDPSSERYVMQPQAHDYLREMHERVFAPRQEALLTVGEMPGVTIEDAIRFTDPKRHELDMVFQFEHVDLDRGPDSKFDNHRAPLGALKRSLARWQDGLADRGWNSLYLGNHDQPRAISRFGTVPPGSDRLRYETATALATALHLHRGTPYIYQGDEIGMTNAGFTTIDDYRDVETLNYYRSQVGRGVPAATVLEAIGFRSRDNARTPIPWTGDGASSFTDGVPWIGMAAAADRINVADDRAAGTRSVFEYYRRLIALRHDSEVVRLGAFALLEPDHKQLWAFRRCRGADARIVLVNCSDEPCPVPDALRARLGPLVLGNLQRAEALTKGPDDADAAGAESVEAAGPRADDVLNVGILAPWEARVFRECTEPDK